MTTKRHKKIDNTINNDNGSGRFDTSTSSDPVIWKAQANDVITKIISYLEDYSIPVGYNAARYVNRQWLNAARNAPSVSIKWNWEDYTPKVATVKHKLTPFELAIKQYPRVTSFIDFPLNDIESILNDQYAPIFFTLLEISLNWKPGMVLRSSIPSHAAEHFASVHIGNGPRFRNFNDVMYRLNKSSQLRLVTIECTGSMTCDDYDAFIQAIESSQLLLEPFNEKEKKQKSPTSRNAPSNEQTTECPSVRFNDLLPIRCPSKRNHGWTYSIECGCCHKASYICCGLPEYHSCNDRRDLGGTCEEEFICDGCWVV
jgi:hypothetical protein